MAKGSSGDDAAEVSTIKIYARVRPQRPNSKLTTTAGRYWISDGATDPSDDDDDSAKSRIGFHMPRDEAAGLINNQRESYEFRFDKLFDVDTKQEEVFDVVAKPVIQSTLEGYNGTIFAYGQTGSGKTFTITGGAERYADRGLIPRTLQFVFKEAQRNPSIQYTFHISYLEIYNEVGYDLLDNSRDAKKLEDLPKVTLQEDGDEMIHLRNLSVVQVANEEEALNLLFVGDTNRMIAETPSNPSSSRSHCIFIVGITSRRSSEDVIRRSKLHLVDLAGSERVARTGIDGTLLKEAKYINLSLHYLEQVIVALREQALGRRTHIPYRNSMMTSVLRDSLGGNCKTTMIATVAVEDELVDESISTCRFAQRVALIANNATLNEEMDPQMIIARLKREVARLRAELAIARSGDTDGSGEEIPDYEKERIKQAVDDYIADTSADAAIILTDFRKIQHAFSVFKSYVRDGRRHRLSDESDGAGISGAGSKTNGGHGGDTSGKAIAINTNGLSAEQVQQFEKLQMLVGHRDNEINILVGMIAQLKAQLSAAQSAASQPMSKAASSLSLTPGGFHATEHDKHAQSISAPRSMEPTITVKSLEQMTASKPDLAGSIPSLTTEKAKAFEIFRRGYPSGEWIEGQKTLLKDKYADAKRLGESASKLRAEIKSLKERLSDPVAGQDQESYRIVLADRVSKYKEAYRVLKDLKLEIEHLQHLLEQARHRLTRDFEHWFLNVYAETEVRHQYQNHNYQQQQQPDLDHTRQSDIASMPSTSSSLSSLGPSPRSSTVSASDGHSSQGQTGQMGSMTAPAAGAAAAAKAYSMRDSTDMSLVSRGTPPQPPASQASSYPARRTAASPSPSMVSAQWPRMNHPPPQHARQDSSISTSTLIVHDIQGARTDAHAKMAAWPLSREVPVQEPPSNDRHATVGSLSIHALERQAVAPSFDQVPSRHPSQQWPLHGMHRPSSRAMTPTAAAMAPSAMPDPVQADIAAFYQARDTMVRAQSSSRNVQHSPSSRPMPSSVASWQHKAPLLSPSPLLLAPTAPMAATPAPTLPRQSPSPHGSYSDPYNRYSSQ